MTFHSNEYSSFRFGCIIEPTGFIMNKHTFHSKKLAKYMSIDLDGGKAFEISTVIGIYKDYLNEQQMSLDSYTTRRLKL